MEHLVSEGLREGHKGIESAQKAQRRTHGSLENPHHRNSSSVSFRCNFYLSVVLGFPPVILVCITHYLQLPGSDVSPQEESGQQSRRISDLLRTRYWYER